MQRELKLTRVCECGEQYGIWRPRCPVCGTINDRREGAMLVGDSMLDVKHKERRLREGVLDNAKRFESKRDPCALCRKRVKQNKRGTNCPSCGARVHVACLALHEASCREFIRERDAIVKGGQS